MNFSKLRVGLLCAASALITGALVAQAQVPGINSTLNSVFTLVYDNSTMKPSYTSTSTMFTIPAFATDVCSLAGSATKTVKVRRVALTGVATAVATEPVEIIKRSASPTGGTQVVDAVTTLDSINAASTVLAEHFTANVTPGTIVGGLYLQSLTYANFTTGVGGSTIFEFGQRAQPIVLRGVLQNVTVNLLGWTPPAGQLNCTFEWTEE